MKTVLIDRMYYRVDDAVAKEIEDNRESLIDFRKQRRKSDSRRAMDLDEREKEVAKREDNIEDNKWNWFLNGCVNFAEGGTSKDAIRKRFEELGGILASQVPK